MLKKKSESDGAGLPACQEKQSDSNSNDQEESNFDLNVEKYELE
jgi:hypothetical protein